MLVTSWLVRALFVALIGDAHSLDVDYWKGALAAQAEGTNPYETGVLNWPPLWLETIVVLNAVARRVDVSFLTALRVYLILVESAIVVTLYVTLVSVGAARAAVRRALLVGIALNPVMIILVCQHGNSDVNVGLLVTLACAALIGYRRSRDVVLWLTASLLLGLGVLAKTTPLILAPLLAPGARRTSWVGRLLGTTLLLLPAAAGLSVLLALVPNAIVDNVLEYRTRPGNFGIAGAIQGVTFTDHRGELAALLVLGLAALATWLWLRRRGSGDPPTMSYLLALLLGMLVALGLFDALDELTIDARSQYDELFTVAIVALVVWLGYRLWREPPLSAETMFLLVAVLFMIVVSFGTGYGAHYAPWFLPALVATYVLLDDAWRRLLLVGYAIAAVTYAVEYGFVGFLGAFVPAILGDPQWALRFGNWLDHPDRWALVRVPLFSMYVVVLAAGLARLDFLRDSRSAGTGDGTSPLEASSAAISPHPHG